MGFTVADVAKVFEGYRFVSYAGLLSSELDAGATPWTGPQLVEMMRDKKVLWVLQDWQHLGPATAVQVLDGPGSPSIPKITH